MQQEKTATLTILELILTPPSAVYSHSILLSTLDAPRLCSGGPIARCQCAGPLAASISLR